jgi:deazaflavin-dependent oxidoreductase (nitroreductase family)
MSDWNTAIIEEFRANGGKVGGNFEGAPLLLLHTTGAKSGQERVAPVMYLDDPENDRLLVFASKAGAPTHPDWYHNLKANPTVTLEVGTDTYTATASELPLDERNTYYAKQAALYPGFQEYEEKTDRVIPVIALTKS